MITRNSLKYYYLCGWKLEIVRDNFRIVIIWEREEMYKKCLGKWENCKKIKRILNYIYIYIIPWRSEIKLSRGLRFFIIHTFCTTFQILNYYKKSINQSIHKSINKHLGWSGLYIISPYYVRTTLGPPSLGFVLI